MQCVVIIDHLESMPFQKARKEITNGTFATITSENHSVSLSWLSGKEAELRDAREAKMLALTLSAKRIAFSAMIIAIIATIIAIIGIIK